VKGSSFSIACALSAAALLLPACGKDKPAPAAPSTPAPTPVPTPTPTPTPTPGSSLACGASVVSGATDSCPRSGATYDKEVEAAIDRLISEKPQIFDFGNQRGGPFVKSPGQYVVGLLKNLQDQGLCADWDGEELQVKKTNDFNDQFDVMLATGHVRRGDSAYRATCTPASFPTPAPPLAPVPGCALAPSREKACGEDDSAYQGDVLAAIDQLRAENPDVFSGNNVRDERAYYDGVINILKAKGFCAIYDGEEVAVKKVNDFSEQYDILLSSGRVRDVGSYQVSCYPAAF
jgi:hypothetical protein